MARQCGDCTVCCTVTRVPELQKPHGECCVFCRAGCAIYDTRPQSCKDFACAWLQGELPKWMRPDRSHVMIERLSNRLVIALPESGHEQDWRTPEIVEQLQKCYQQKGVAVVASDKRALIPDGHTAEEVSRALHTIAKLAGVV